MQKLQNSLNSHVCDAGYFVSLPVLHKKMSTLTVITCWRFTTEEEVLDLHTKVDLVITLGGDGTVLWVSHSLWTKYQSTLLNYLLYGDSNLCLSKISYISFMWFEVDFQTHTQCISLSTSSLVPHLVVILRQ